ncbi:MAG: LysR family transcriptional regulator [Flavobacteriales bacterium]|jgi:DNA-binding transcriptional LysR family regulator|nr:LysR family transcriptional regulator [Flavobacteriales bacterium]
MNYTFHQLKVFVCIVKNQSVTKASEELYLTQPAVSSQLKKLQDQFDIPLTEVVGRKLFITEFGKEIAEVCKRILLASEELKETVNQYKGLISGHLKIAVVSTGKYVMPYFLSGFTKRFPSVDVVLDVTNKQLVVAALAKNETDFALVSVLPNDLPLQTVALMENSLHLVGSAESVKAIKGKKMTPSDLSEAPLIFREHGSATRNAMEQYLDTHSVKVNQKYELVSNEAVKQAVNAGLGFSIMPLIGLRNVLNSGEVGLIEIQGLPVKTQWTLCYLKGKKLSPAASTFINYLESHKEQLIETHFSWTKIH